MTLPESGLATSKETLDNGLVLAYNSLNAIFIRLQHFDVLNATGVATIMNKIDAAIKAGIPDEKLAEMPADFTTAGKAYIPAYWTLVQSMIAQKNIREQARVTQKLIAAGAGVDLWHDTEWRDAVNEFDESGLLRISWLDELIAEMNPIIKMGQGNEYRHFPDSVYLMWAPSLTITEFRAILQTLVSNSDGAANYFSKCGVAYIQNAKLDKIMDTPCPTFDAFDFDDEKWRFWATHGWVKKYNAGGNTDIYASDHTAVQFAVSDANWWGKTFYQYQVGEDGMPSSRPYILYDLVRMFYQTDAENLFGCTDKVDITALGSNDALAANDFYIARVAARDQDGDNEVKFYYVSYDTADLWWLALIHFFCFSHNSTLTFTKSIADACIIEYSPELSKIGWRNEFYSVAAIEKVNYSHEYRFFRKLIRGISKTGTKYKNEKVRKKKPMQRNDPDIKDLSKVVKS